jgi:hypothetical protein
LSTESTATRPTALLSVDSSAAPCSIMVLPFLTLFFPQHFGGRSLDQTDWSPAVIGLSAWARTCCILVILPDSAAPSMRKISRSDVSEGPMSLDR